MPVDNILLWESQDFLIGLLAGEKIPCEAHHCRNLSVAETPQLIHSIGHPMSQATQFGFSCPPIWSFRFRERSGFSQRLCWPVRKSRACGVANFSASTTIVERLFCDPFFPLFRFWYPCLASLAQGVGHMPRAFAALRLLLPPSSPVVRGVGHNPDSVSLVRRSGVGSSQHTPPRIIPHRGKITEDHGKTSSHKHR